MKKLRQTTFLFFFSFLLVSIVSAQNITGTWKRSAILIEKSDGSKSDAYPAQQKSMPCATTITYTYTTAGDVLISASDCGKMKEVLEAMNGKTRWKQNGRKLTITTTDVEFPTQIYTVDLAGNTMSWVFSYADNPTTPNPAKSKSMTIVYKR